MIRRESSSFWMFGTTLSACIWMIVQQLSAQVSCGSPAENDIVCENLRAGTPKAVWDITGAGDPSIQGFAGKMSVRRGERLEFKIATDASAYRLDLYRVGYYAGAGARFIATVLPSVSLPVRQPTCLSDGSTGLVDCGNWETTATWQVPADAISGVYLAKVVRTDTGGASHILFVVRDDDSRSAIVVQTSDTTWQAYNDYGGNSLYSGAPVGRAYKVSYNRPLVTRGNQFGRTSFWTTEYPLIRWLERNGYDASYISGIDSDRNGSGLLKHRIFISLGHDEYWSAAQRNNVTAARDKGVHLAFLTGNTMFWKVRWEPSLDASHTPYRTLVAYKETHAGMKIDPDPTPTGTWRDPRFGLVDGSGVPENALIGTQFLVNCCRFDSLTVSAEEGRRRFWRHTELARLPEGGSLTLGVKTIGAEWDTDFDNGHRPPGLIRLSTSTTTGSPPSKLADFGSTYRDWTGPATHHLTLYKHPSGALVFSAGSMNWSWAFDTEHDDPDKAAAPADTRIQQATVNLLADMGVQPQSLVEGLVAATPSTDVTPPTAAITSPEPLEKRMFYRSVRLSGTASDVGGVPAAVEVSVDDGLRWRPAVGASSWHYDFTPPEPGLVTVLVRAVDDSGNLQVIPTSMTFDVVGGRALIKGVRGLVRRLLPIGAGLFFLGIVAFLIWLRRRHASAQAAGVA